MLLRTSISNTKKFFKKTLQSFKSFVSGGGHYQKLPKSPPFIPFSCSHKTDMNFNQNYEELNHQFYTDKCDSNEDNAKKTSKKKIVSSPLKNETDEAYPGRSMKSAKSSSNKSYHEEERGDKDRERKRNIVVEGKGRKHELKYSCCKGLVKEKEGIRSCLVLEKKLKELEMMDKSNIEHVLDIEEVLHYYSRLTCPAYLDIVDKFFKEIYAEFGSVE